MALKNIYFDSWKEYENFVKEQVENIARNKPVSLANWEYPEAQEVQDEEAYYEKKAKLVEKQVKANPEDFKQLA